ncbi:hypothetical protein DFH08DRAFT_1079855 [Mycena albidolilacea]|uniref:Uncharacterized protein n=1 Tax=Mycena albidolilacea TaxID=1033008 RepID=A0AAD7A2R3_9AGAR|nr:hypothetical protein DFH08DRAFT_1079855 [Mycena albidolilacea]
MTTVAAWLATNGYSAEPEGLSLDLIAQLRRFGGSNNIISLTASFENLDIPTLGTICAFFPSLAELRIDTISQVELDANDETQGATGSFTELAGITTLPAVLERLALTYIVEYEDPETAPPADVPKFDKLRDALVARYTSPTALRLDGQDFLFNWGMLDGLEVEATAGDAGEIFRRNARRVYCFFGDSVMKPQIAIFSKRSSSRASLNPSDIVAELAS